MLWSRASAATSRLSRNQRRPNTACWKQVSVLLPRRVPRSRRSARNSRPTYWASAGARRALHNRRSRGVPWVKIVFGSVDLGEITSPSTLISPRSRRRGGARSCLRQGCCAAARVGSRLVRRRGRQHDGYPLRHVVRRWIRCLEIEPSVNVGAAAREKVVSTFTAFLTAETGALVRAIHGPADLVIANNVRGAVPTCSKCRPGAERQLSPPCWLSSSMTSGKAGHPDHRHHVIGGSRITTG
jgi:hypothetical protein